MNWYALSKTDLYLDAVRSGDMDKAQEIINSAASAAGFTVLAHHGTRKFEGTRFDRQHSAQGIFWFSESRGKIESGDSGASGFSTILSVFLYTGKAAGWEEYEKYALGQISSIGFNSIHLDDDWAIFEPQQIKLSDPVTYTPSGNVIHVSKRFNLNNKDMRY